jgi:hypothetical protein
MREAVRMKFTHRQEGRRQGTTDSSYIALLSCNPYTSKPPVDLFA